MQIKSYNSHMGAKGWDYSHFNLQPNTWYPVIQRGGRPNCCEISVCHSSEPHGFQSWGWDGAEKLVVYSVEEIETENKKHRVLLKRLFEHAKKSACELAEELNKETKRASQT